MDRAAGVVSATSRPSQERLLARTTFHEKVVNFTRRWGQSPAVTGKTAVKVAESLMV